MREGGANKSGRYGSDYQPVADALETETGVGPEERDPEKQDVSVYASRAAKMTDTKSVSSVEVPEGKLMKKVSGYSLRNIRFVHRNFCGPT